MKEKGEKEGERGGGREGERERRREWEFGKEIDNQPYLKQYLQYSTDDGERPEWYEHEEWNYQFYHVVAQCLRLVQYLWRLVQIVAEWIRNWLGLE